MNNIENMIVYVVVVVVMGGLMSKIIWDWLKERKSFNYSDYCVTEQVFEIFKNNIEKRLDKVEERLCLMEKRFTQELKDLEEKFTQRIKDLERKIDDTILKCLNNRKS